MADVEQPPLVSYELHHQPPPASSGQQQQAYNLSCMSESLLYWYKGLPFRLIVGLSCCLSIVGALLIVLSYVLFKSLRSRARLVLVHLSLMDLGVSLMNLLGNIIHFDSYYVHNAPSASTNITSTNPNAVGDERSLICQVYYPPESKAIQRTCTAQAFLAHYFTYGSVLWTIALAVFIYFVIVHYRKSYVKNILRASYVVCYGLPMIVCIWLFFTGRLGYSPNNGLWCSIILEQHNKKDTYAAFFGYDLWIYLAFLVVPIFFIAVKLYIREKIIVTKTFLPEAEARFWEALYILDYKFFLIPFVFFLLRIWACIQFMIHYYINASVPMPLHVTLNYLASIGDSSQGFANAILFILFTKKVRVTLFTLSYWRKLFRHKPRHGTDDDTSCLLSTDSNPPIESEILTPSKFTESLPKSVCVRVENSRQTRTIN